MTRYSDFVMLLAGLSMFACALCVESAEKEEPAYKPVEDQPGLPRVLLLGDSISIGYTLPVRELLAGKANVHRPPENCSATIHSLPKIDAWLGDKTWDVIHFNWGLHDLAQVNSDRKRVSDITGMHQVPLPEYEKNLRTLTRRLKRTGAKLIWCSTTPVPEGAAGRVPGDEAKYNAAAAKIMADEGVVIDDLCGFAVPQLATIQRKRDVHYTPEGSKVLAKQVAASIEKQLGTGVSK